MIGAGSLGASACTEPFFKRAPGGGGAGIVRTSIGTVVDRAALLNPTTSLATPIIPANSFLLVAVTQNGFLTIGSVAPVLVGAGITLTLAQFIDFGTIGDNVTFVWYRYGGALAADTLTWTWPATAPDFSAFACYVTGLSGTVDLNAVNAAGPGTTQGSGAIGVITAPAYGMGVIGTDGRDVDTVGTWNDGVIPQPPNVNPVANAGTSNLNGVQLKVGEVTIAAIQQMSTGVTGATSRRFGAITQAFR